MPLVGAEQERAAALVEGVWWKATRRAHWSEAVRMEIQNRQNLPSFGL